MTMLRCVREHEADGFGTIPKGSLWDDESPYVVERDAFVDADAKPKKAAAKRAAEKGDD